MRTTNIDKNKVSRRAGRCQMDAQWNEDPKTGYMDITMYPAAPGILVYRRKDPVTGEIKTVKELVTKEVLHDAAVRASLENKPILNEHRYDSNGDGVKITEVNAKGELSGWTKGEHKIATDGARTQIDGVIVDQELKALIKSGKHQVSPGYDSYIDPTPGVDETFGPYDERQVYREYNHIVVTWKGRGGAKASLKLDSDTLETYKKYNVDSWEIDPGEADEIKKEFTPMDKTKDEGKVEDAPRFNADAAEIVRLSKQIGSLETANADLTGQIKALGDELKTAKAFNIDSAIETGVNKRSALIDEALPHLAEGTTRASLSGKNDFDIKKAVVAAKYDSQDFDDSEIEGAYKVAIQTPKQAETKNTPAGVKIKAAYDSATPEDEADPIAAAYARSLEQITKGNK